MSDSMLLSEAQMRRIKRQSITRSDPGAELAAAAMAEPKESIIHFRSPVPGYCVDFRRSGSAPAQSVPSSNSVKSW